MVDYWRCVGLMLIKLLTLTAIARYFEYSWRNSFSWQRAWHKAVSLPLWCSDVAQSESVLSQAMLQPLTLNCDVVDGADPNFILVDEQSNYSSLRT